MDNVSIKDFGKWFSENWKEPQSQLIEGNYQLQSVRGVKIPKPKEGYRQLGIPTVKYRVVQQAINQVLQPIFDPKFSTRSYGFRTKHNAHQALPETRKIVQSGKRTVLDLNLANFFDEVNHKRLMWLLSIRIGDRRMLRFLFKIPSINKMQNGLEEQRIK